MKAVGWVVLHGCVVHIDVHGEVMLWVTMADVVCLVCRSYGVHEHAVLNLYVWHVGVSVML